MPTAVLGVWIAIAVSGPAPSNAEREELLRACSEAIGGRCTLSDEDESGGTPDAVAVIKVDVNLTRARVELGRAGVAWKKSDLAFAEADSPKERWRALGLTLATLFGGPAAEQPKPDAPRRPPVPASPPRATPAPEEDEESPPRDNSSWLRLGAGLSTGPALAEGPLRWGAVLRGSVGPFGGFIEPTVAVGYAMRPGSSRDLDVRFITLSAGAAVSYSPAEPFTLRLRLEAAGEWVSVSQTAPPDSGTRLVPGALVGLEAAWPARSRLAGFVGGEFWMFTGGTAIRAGSERVASVPSRRFAALAGILLELQ